MPQTSLALRGNKVLKAKLERLAYRDGFWAVILLLPNLLGFLIFTLWPVFVSLYLSLCSYDILTPAEFIGLENYRNLFADETFRQVFNNTILFTIGTVPTGIIMSLFLAVALDQPIKGIRFFRVSYFMPVISSMVAVAVVWQWLYNPEFGLLNYFLSLLGVKGPNWLTSEGTALTSIMIVAVWKGLGYNMLLFLAGLQNISNGYYEAAEIDGARWWDKFINITVPLLTPTTFFVTVMALINSFQVFDLVMLMTEGGPGRATSVIVHYLYQNAFQFFKMGYASAIAYVLFFVIMGVTLIQLKLQGKWVNY